MAFVLFVLWLLVTLYSVRRRFTTGIKYTDWRQISYIRGASPTASRYNELANPVNHIAFLKIFKAASTTVQNIFLRYGDEKNFTENSFSRRILKIPGDNPVLEYLMKRINENTLRNKYDNSCNFMSIRPYGVPNTKDDDKVREYLHKLENEMDIVLVVEYLDESLVLMRRMLDWDLRHVLYAKLRVNKVQTPRLKFGSDVKELHKNCAQLEYLFYEFFLNKIKELINKQQQDFYEELSYFRKTRIKYDNFCSSVIQEELQNTEMTFPGSPWNKPFVITLKQCKRQYIHDVVYLNILKKKQQVEDDSLKSVPGEKDKELISKV
ncbi:uncharacterized protein [Argopecten irradians]|uniref:uncharacterized protein n=1 Tax=Argopecten irradians TaxID=31199 RepID=UPI00372086B5